MKNPLLTIVLMVFVIVSNAQSPGGLYMPIEFQRAYENGTRMLDGSVSSRYWQNRSTYRIKAEIDPVTKLLKGSAVITYTNNSPDSIRNPTFHTYHDYYKPGAERLGFFSGDSEVGKNDGMVIGKLVVDGVAYDPSNDEDVYDGGTFKIIRLKKPVPPKGKMTLEIDWHLTIVGEGFERSGAIDNTSMFVGYWYPEMAVLDDINGWDHVVYNAATEFYHDYSDYDVEITAPDNFTVWASVAPSNEKEVYSAQIRERLAKGRTSATPVKILTEADINKKPAGKRTWRYTARNFPDFAFALSDHFLWDAHNYKDKHGEYFFQIAYPPDHPEFASVNESIAKSLNVFHTKFPVYPFPYKYFTIFNGLHGGGMEFPGMANDDNITGKEVEQYFGVKMTDQEANFGLTLHEMCHMYFPFMMGINEKHYAWMDEGFANFSEFFIPPWPSGDWEQDYLGSQSVLPMMAPSHEYKSSGINSYTVAAHSYNALYHLLGEETFIKCLNTYIQEWQYKHPTPYDFMFAFNRVSGKDLTWFWKKWYFDWGYVDIGIADFASGTLAIENKGGRPIPFSVKVTYEDGTEASQLFNPAVWKDASRTSWKVPTGNKKLAAIELVIQGEGDALRSNNFWKP